MSDGVGQFEVETPAAKARAALTKTDSQSSVRLEMASVVVDSGYIKPRNGPMDSPEISPHREPIVACASCGPSSGNMDDSLNNRLSSTVLLGDGAGAFVPATPTLNSEKHSFREDAGRVRNTRESIMDKIHTFMDLFVVEPRPANMIGSTCTVLIVIASIVYGVILLFQALGLPLHMENHVLWSLSYTFPCEIQCKAPSGCRISNTLKANEPQPCINIANGEKLDLQIGRSEDPAMGISVAALRSGSEAIVTINSDMYMDPNPGLPADNPMNAGIQDHTVDMPSPVPQGTSLVWYVQTRNQTLEGRGAFRREFFVQQVNNDGGVLDGSTSCDVPLDWVQGRIRLMPQWNEVVVSYQISLMDWFGTSAGMYAAFVSWGALVVGTYEFWMDHH